MSDSIVPGTGVTLTGYGPQTFAPHLPFASRGYFFTVPGTFPEDVHASLNVTDWKMAVYRTHSQARSDWEVRDVNGNRKVWAEATTRREAVGMAFLEVARVRRERAAEIAHNRVSILGLEPVPPYLIETTAGTTFVLTPDSVGILTHIDPPADGATTATYDVTDLDTGAPKTVPAGGTTTLHPITAGILHHRCPCQPAMILAHFENEEDATDYGLEALTVMWPCLNTVV
ncbi:hypothetical protein ACFWAP_09075 [Streptomyces goshikiensis]|uniref:hypothetical protein n=1 Tax=Streptomyces goshikiensis TaxID=1942 RepID=UPI003666D86F